MAKHYLTWKYAKYIGVVNMRLFGRYHDRDQTQTNYSFLEAISGW